MSVKTNGLATFNFDNDQRIIFSEITENRRVNYYQLEDALRKSNGHSKMTHNEMKQLIREKVENLKELRWIGEIVSSNDELSIFYITADGSIASDDRY